MVSRETQQKIDPIEVRRCYHQELVRTYIARQLAEYYAQPAEAVVGSTKSNSFTSFSPLFGEWHWKRVFQNLYDTREGRWLTPVELFKPHYSRILANFCCEQALLFSSNPSSLSPFEIVEIGCGRGTNANLILSYLHDTKPNVYEQLRSYTLVDSSPSLYQLQKELLADGFHSNKLTFELKDLVDVAERRDSLLLKSETPTVVLGLEVLDNLPHDKIRGKTRDKLEQAEILWKNRTDSSSKKEVFMPLLDPLLQKIINKVPSYVSSHPRWVPSVACGVLHHLVQHRPNLALVLADFDWLPHPDLDPQVPLQHVTEISEGEPIVTDMVGIDHECYLTAPPQCDILFPTNFDKLASFVKKSLSKDQLANLTVKVEKQSDFLQRWGPEHVKNTRSWIGLTQRHNPLLHDVSNGNL